MNDINNALTLRYPTTACDDTEAFWNLQFYASGEKKKTSMQWLVVHVVCIGDQ